MPRRQNSLFSIYQKHQQIHINLFPFIKKMYDTICPISLFLLLTVTQYLSLASIDLLLYLSLPLLPAPSLCPSLSLPLYISFYLSISPSPCLPTSLSISFSPPISPLVFILSLLERTRTQEEERIKES